MVNSELRAHLVAHVDALLVLDRNLDRLQAWGEHLAGILLGGGRLLACGNGGSAAESHHLVSELVGRFSTERRPLSAIALVSDTSSLSAIANDYGWSEGLARQAVAHGRRGDVLVAISTTGRSENVLEAARAARRLGMRVWGLTGPAPNPLLRLCHDALAVPGSTPVAQELHLVAIHLLCAVVDAAVARRESGALEVAG
jgi:D-sedoheptulose 7-phosphate isomerase